MKYRPSLVGTSFHFREGSFIMDRVPGVFSSLFPAIMILFWLSDLTNRTHKEKMCSLQQANACVVFDPSPNARRFFACLSK